MERRWSNGQRCVIHGRRGKKEEDQKLHGIPYAMPFWGVYCFINYRNSGVDFIMSFLYIPIDEDLKQSFKEHALKLKKSMTEIIIDFVKEEVEVDGET